MKINKQTLINFLFFAGLSLATTAPAGTAQQTTGPKDTFSDQQLILQAKTTILLTLPFVSTAYLRNAYGRTARADYNDLIYKTNLNAPSLAWSPPRTPLIHVAGFMNLQKFGPMIISIPQTTNTRQYGHFFNAWQQPLHVINVAPTTQQAGKFLIVPQHFQKPLPAGFEVITADTHNVWFEMQVSPLTLDDTIFNHPHELLKEYQIYPLSQHEASDAKPIDIDDISPGLRQDAHRRTRLIDITQLPFSTEPDFDHRYFRALNQFLAEEVKPVDKTLLANLAAIGIEPGKPFTPDEKMLAVYNQAAQDLARFTRTR